MMRRPASDITDEMGQHGITHAILLLRKENGKIYVTPSEESAVRALAWFRSYMDPRLRFSGSSAPPQATERPIGTLENAEVIVRDWEPSLRDEDLWSQEGSGITFDEWVNRQRGSASA